MRSPALLERLVVETFPGIDAKPGWYLMEAMAVSDVLA